MSKIVFVVDNLGSRRSQAISIIRQHTGLSIAEVLRKTESGVPILEPVLFGRDHAEIATHLTKLSQGLLELDVDFRMFELSESEEFCPDCEGSYFKLDVGTLINILTEHEKEMKRQRSLAFRER